MNAREIARRHGGAWLRSLLLAVILVSGLIAVVTVSIIASASSRISVEAERSLWIAEMQSAVQVESQSAALFVADMPAVKSDDQGAGHPAMGEEGEQPETGTQPVAGEELVHPGAPADSASELSDHPDVAAATESYRRAAAQVRIRTSPDQRPVVDEAIVAHSIFVETMTLLNQAAHSGDDAMAVYHADTQVAETELRSSLEELRDAAASGLAEAVERTATAQDLLGLALPVAAGAGLVAAVGLVRSRASWRRMRFLEELVDAKDRFISTVSHELRTPLAAMVGFAQLLNLEEPSLENSDRREYLSLILSQGNELAAIVDDLLVAARAEIGELTVDTKPLEVAAQLRQVLDTLSPSLASIQMTGPELRALGDPGRVRQVLRNLLTNAHRYGGPSVRVDFSVREDIAVIRVLDDGEPIPQEYRDLIFEPYVTVRDGRPVTGSMGLGLAVSRQLARRMGGDLRYLHEDGHSLFEFTLLLDDTEAPDRGEPAPELVEARA